MKTAVVLLNLGGPDNPMAVRPFLENLFNDPAIIRAPTIVRKPLAWWIAKRREREAQDIYSHLGGSSPILLETQIQADALQKTLEKYGEFKVFVAMRYWHPMTDAVAEAVKSYSPDKIVLLPLYPQYSTATTLSSQAEWHRAASEIGLGVDTRMICCYPTMKGFVEAQAKMVREAQKKVNVLDEGRKSRVLFSAHGLPEKIIKSGDPYQWQVEQTAKAVASKAGLNEDNWLVCYQSRVGPLKWIGPETKSEIERAGSEGISVIIVPIAFVSEHSETLVELDIEYREIADKTGVPVYERVGTVRDNPVFINGLRKLVIESLNHTQRIKKGNDSIECPADLRCCALT